MNWPRSFSQVAKVGTRGFRSPVESERAGMGPWVWSGSLGAEGRCAVRIRSPQVTQEAGSSVWINQRYWVVSVDEDMSRSFVSRSFVSRSFG